MNAQQGRSNSSTEELSNWLRHWHGRWSRTRLTEEQRGWVLDEWFGSARTPQYPLGLTSDTWLVIGGRGAGKTRLGAEWVNGLVRRLSPFSLSRYGQIALVGETFADVREVMIGGPSGIATVSRHDRPRYEVSRRRLLWSNGAVAQAFSAESPDALRGPQFEAAWCDELGKWRLAEACFDMLQFCLRLGERPRQLITTTPRPIRLLRRLVAEPAVDVTRMTTGDNAANLAASFLKAVTERYGNTRLGRQEIGGELLVDREDGLWNRALLEQAVAPPAGELRRIVVAVDPPAASGRRSDACGIVAAGLDQRGHTIVLADETTRGLTPVEWAGRAVRLYHRLKADCLVAEVNQGGEMVATVLRSVDAGVPVKTVHARRGKWLRAEPVAALYEQGRVRHARRFSELEDEMCDFGPDGLSAGRSPDRVDALVWAVSELMLTGAGSPRIRDFQ
ncbi:MAG: terminase family protein [Rhizobiaceae bacterium]